MTVDVSRKDKKCKICGARFTPWSSFQRCCMSASCAIAMVRKDKAAEARPMYLAVRRAQREAKERLKTRGQWMKEAQGAYNAYIRARDQDLPCISCGDFTPMTRGGDYDCGHYRSVGANPELRFEELNTHKQCKRCNGHLSGNIVNYRIGLLMRIGEEKVAWLEGPHEPKKYTIEDLKGIKAKYSRMVRGARKLAHGEPT